MRGRSGPLAGVGAAFSPLQRLPGIWGCRVSGLSHLSVSIPPIVRTPGFSEGWGPSKSAHSPGTPRPHGPLGPGLGPQRALWAPWRWDVLLRRGRGRVSPSSQSDSVGLRPCSRRGARRICRDCQSPPVPHPPSCSPWEPAPRESLRQHLSRRVASPCPDLLQ